MHRITPPALDFLPQTLVFLIELLEFTLETLRDRTQGNGFDQFLFASQNVLLHHFGVAGTRAKLQEALKMINRGGRILLLSLVQEARFEMSQGRMRIGFESFFKTVERPFIVKSVNAAFAGQKVRILFLIQLTARREKAAGKSQAEDQDQRAANQSNEERHGPHFKRGLQQSSIICWHPQ